MLFSRTLSLEKKLEKLARKYTYRGLEWVSRLKQPITFPESKTIVFDDFYSHSGHAYNGVCNELMVQAFIDINKDHRTFGALYTEGRIYRVKGGDPLFFSLPPTETRDQYGNIISSLPRRSRGDHLFLAITNKRIAENNSKLSGEDARAALLDGNAIIFDPSFGIVEKLSESDYLINTIWSPGYETAHAAKSAVFNNGNFGQPSHVLGISGGLIFSLDVQYAQTNERLYSVGLRMIAPGFENGALLPLDSSTLDYAAKHFEGLAVFLKHMRDVCKKSVQGTELEQYKNSVIIW